MSADSIIAKCMSTVPKALAAGVVDLTSGMLMAIKTTDSHPQQVLDLVAAATSELFEGETVKSIEDHFRRARGDTYDGSYFREIIVTSYNLVHVFARMKSTDSMVAVVVVRNDANLGMVLAKFREIAQTETV
ncbi:MAG: hypothetical protein ACPGUC_02685 [Gammaproteobacteria bacterium]